jgi:drug/metabolite transporter (DMT)-like permease
VAASWLPVDPAWREMMPFILVGWPQVTTILLGFLAILAVLNLFGNLFLSRAYQTADSSLLAPLDFTYLLLIALWGRVLFDSWPTPLAILGMAMIAAAGMITAMRERHRPFHTPAPRQSG